MTVTEREAVVDGGRFESIFGEEREKILLVVRLQKKGIEYVFFFLYSERILMENRE